MEKKFHYSLLGLQRVQNYQIDQLTSRLAGLKDELKQNQARIESLEIQIREHELEMVRLIREQPAFWLEYRSTTTLYLADLRAERQKAVDAQEKLVGEIVQLMGEIIDSQKKRKLLERHKGIMHDMHSRAENNRHSMLIDEHVLRKSILNTQKRSVA